MYSKYTLAFVVSIAVVAWPLERAKAQEGLIGGIIGGVIGGAIANDQRRRAAPQRTVRTVPSSVQREQNREVQRALNHFGWNVGTADGVIGRNTRSGISQYQVFIGHAGTGQLTEFERNILTTAFQRAVIGGAQVSQTIATHDAGLRGLVLVVRDEFRGHATTASAGNYGLPAVVARAVDEIASSSDPTAAQLVERAGFVQLADLNGDGRTDYILDTSVTGSSFWCSAQACTVRVFVSTPDGYVRNDFQAFDVTPASFDCHRGACSLTEPGTAPAGRTQPGGVTEAAAGSGAASPDSGGVPDFFAAAADGPPPLGSQCNRIGLQTERNGGRVTLAAMTDPLFALSEQFCLVRAHSIADGEDLMTKIQGASARQIAEQCAGFAPSLQPLVTVLGRAPQADVLDAVDRFIADTGLSSQQLAGTARVCLGVGYQSENITMAIGSALLLAGLGESRYAEVAGHHLVQGVGVPARLDLGRAWFDTAFTQGQDAGFVPGDSGRAGLIRVALRTLAGEDSAPADTVARDGGAVPVFSIAPGD